MAMVLDERRLKIVWFTGPNAPSDIAIEESDLEDDTDDDDTDDETDAQESSSQTVGLPNDVLFHERVKCCLPVENESQLWDCTPLSA